MAPRLVAYAALTAFLLAVLAADGAIGAKVNYFDDFLFDSLNAQNAVLKPRGKTPVVWQKENDNRPSKNANRLGASSVNATATSIPTRLSKQPLANNKTGNTPVRTTALAAGKQRTTSAIQAIPTLPIASGWPQRFKSKTTTTSGRLTTSSAARDDDDEEEERSDEDDDDDEDSDGSGDRSRNDDDDDSGETSSKGTLFRKHKKRQSGSRHRHSSSQRPSSISEDFDRLRNVPRENWSCCMLGKLAGDKGFDCHAQFYSRRLLDRNINRAHNRRMSDTYFANGRTTPTAMRLMTQFSTCVRHQADEFHDCCREALNETVARQDRWRRFEAVVTEVRLRG